MTLAVREPGLAEIMDGPCDEARLFATYRHFALANRVVSGWRRIYTSRLRPRLRTGPLRLLDIGFGGGDIPRALANWADADGLDLDVTAIDPDERALRYVRSSRAGVNGAAGDAEVRFLAASSRELLDAGERFDVVVSNHVLHHLEGAERAELLADSAAFGAQLVIHDDIERSRLAYAAWAVGALPFAADSFALVDGLRSIRRSYTAPELVALAPGWRVERMFPWRLLVVRDEAS